MDSSRRMYELAERQLGLATHEQLVGLGIPPSTISRWARTGRLRRPEPGVYAIGGSPSTWRQEVLAAVLAGGPEAFASHRTAAALRCFDGVVGRSIEVLVPFHHRRPRSSVIVHESRDLPIADRSLADGIPTTSVERTLIDCGRWWHEDRVGRVLDAAVRDRLTTYDRVVERFDGLARRGRPGIATVRRVLADRELLEGHTGYGFEDRVLRLLHRARLPVPARQHPLDVEHHRYYLDVAYPDATLGIECDSRRFHTLAAQIEADLDRQNRILRSGFMLLRYTPKDLRTDPDRIVREVSEQLKKRAPGELS